MKRPDPKGYYTRLGVPPTATAPEIKVAFRRRALELHPDRNLNRDTTQEFQDLSEAYQVLSHPRSRAEYDAHWVATSPPSSQTATVKETPPEPLTCGGCGKVTAQPRYTIFYEVKSFIFMTLRSPIQGIFCHTCAEKKALRATTLTWLLGWWGLPWGCLYSMQALWQNLRGGLKPDHINARLLAYQAWSFAERGKPELARAIAADALEFVERLQSAKPNRKASSAIDRELRAEGAQLRATLNDFLATLDPSIPTKRLKNLWGFPSRSFYLQGGILVAVLLTVILPLGLGLGNWVLGRVSDRPEAEAWLSSDQSDQTVATWESLPYQRPPFADNGSSWPTTSGYIDGYPRIFTDGNLTITIDNSRNQSDVFVKLFALTTLPPTPARVMLVRSLDRFAIANLPAGIYEIRYQDLKTGNLFRIPPFYLQDNFILEDNGGRDVTVILNK